jgi:hypothetical protein
VKTAHRLLVLFALQRKLSRSPGCFGGHGFGRPAVSANAGTAASSTNAVIITIVITLFLIMNFSSNLLVLLGFIDTVYPLSSRTPDGTSKHNCRSHLLLQLYGLNCCTPDSRLQQCSYSRPLVFHSGNLPSSLPMLL